MKLIIDLLTQLPKWFVTIMLCVFTFTTLICLWVMVDATFVSKQRKEIFGLGFGPLTTFDSQNSKISMIKADHRKLSTIECLQIGRMALSENGYDDITVESVYVFGKFREQRGLTGNVGIDCGTQPAQNYPWINVFIAISGRNLNGEVARLSILRDYYYNNSELAYPALLEN